jgi:hypothetical protein
MKEVLESTKAEMTLPKALKDMLIFVASWWHLETYGGFHK